jgi:hypothetical protein
MTSILIFGLLVLNLVISWWNCRVVGSIWHESKFVGGFMRALAWCGAIQAAVGFSSVIMLLLVFSAYATGYLPVKYADGAASLWYLLVVFPAIGTGLIITVHSLITAWRERSIANMGVAAWNTFASGMNLYNAFSDVPDAFDKVSDMFSGDKDDQKVALVILIVAIAIGGGILITALLIRHYARQHKPQVVLA